MICCALNLFDKLGRNINENIQTVDRNKFFFISDDYLQNARMYQMVL